MKVVKRKKIFNAEMFHSKGNIPKYVYYLNKYFGSEEKAYYIDTEIGSHELKDGDWIVTDEKGEISAYSDEDFRNTFQREDE